MNVEVCVGCSRMRETKQGEWLPWKENHGLTEAEKEQRKYAICHSCYSNRLRQQELTNAAQASA